jgi:hypothetical protein
MSAKLRISLLIGGMSLLGCKPPTSGSGNTLSNNDSGPSSSSSEVCRLSPAQSRALAMASEIQNMERISPERLPSDVRRIADGRTSTVACGADVLGAISASFPSVAYAFGSKSQGGPVVESVGLVGEGMFGSGVATVEVVPVGGTTYYFGRNSSGMVIETIRLMDHRPR